MAAGPSLGSLVTGGYEDLGSQGTLIRSSMQHQLTTNMCHMCQCTAIAGICQGTLRYLASDKQLTQIQVSQI